MAKELKIKKLGQQYTIDFYGCIKEVLADNDAITKMMLEAAKIAKATIVTHDFHYFQPHGISGAVIIQESHFAIHTWPEYNYAAIDIFTCGDIDTKSAFNYFKTILKPTKIEKKFIKRGKLQLVKKSMEIKKHGKRKTK